MRTSRGSFYIHELLSIVPPLNSFFPLVFFLFYEFNDHFSWDRRSYRLLVIKNSSENFEIFHVVNVHYILYNTVNLFTMIWNVYYILIKILRIIFVTWYYILRIYYKLRIWRDENVWWLTSTEKLIAFYKYLIFHVIASQ